MVYTRVHVMLELLGSKGCNYPYTVVKVGGSLSQGKEQCLFVVQSSPVKGKLSACYIAVPGLSMALQIQILSK